MLTVVAAMAVLTASCSGPEPLAATLTESVEFESVSLPGRLWDPFMPPITDGRPVTITGVLTVPPTDAPVPAVIIAHGCGGVGAVERSWAAELADAGIATLVVDSFAARGISSLCGGTETVNVLSPVIDVYRAADAIDDHPYVDASRLAVLGFSFGGRAAIWSGLTRFREAYDGRAFSGHLAFYPSTCYIELADEDLGDSPVRIFHGTADDWTPIDQCEAMAERMVASGSDVLIHAYPGARHGFDNATLGWAAEQPIPFVVSPRNCRFVEQGGAIIDTDTGGVAGVGSTCVERGVIIGFDADARAAAATDLLADLAQMFAP